MRRWEKRQNDNIKTLKLDPFFIMTGPTIGGIACLSILKKVKVTGVKKGQEGVRSKCQMVYHTNTETSGTPIVIYFCKSRIRGEKKREGGAGLFLTKNQNSI